MTAALLGAIAAHYVDAAVVPVSVKSIGVAKNSSNTATMTAITAETVPTAVGDVVVVIHVNDYYVTTNMGTPSANGAPTMHTIAVADAGTNQAHCKTWWYNANTAGAQSVSVTENPQHDEDKLILAMVLAGVNKTTFLDGTPVGSFGTAASNNPPIPAPSVSPVAATSYLFCLATSGYPNTPNVWTPPAGMTKLAEVFQPGPAVAGTSVSVAGLQLAASGATGVKTFTTTAAMNGQSYTATSFAALTS